LLEEFLILPREALAEVLFWVTVAACIVAQVALVRSAFRTPPAPTPEHPMTAPTRASEIAWSVVPAIMLAVVLMFTWRAIHPPSESPAPSSSVGSSLIS
jgi:heme/copper-type cytochrome/quinol oxidase subunit 2